MRSLAISNDGTLLAAVNDEVKIFFPLNPPSFPLPQGPLSPHPCYTLAPTIPPLLVHHFVPYPLYLSYAKRHQGNCYIWQIDGQEFHALKMLAVHAPAYALKCKFSPDGRYIREWVYRILSRIGRGQIRPPLPRYLDYALSYILNTSPTSSTHHPVAPLTSPF